MPAPTSTLSPAPPVKRFRRRLITCALIAGAFLASCTGLEIEQRKWIFQPRSAEITSTGDLAAFAHQYGMEDVWIEHRSSVSGRPIRLHALWAPNDDPAAPLLLYLHGARRDVDSNVYRIEPMRDLGFSVLAVDYRGFGNSTDELPSEDAAVEDARAAWNWLGAHHAGSARYLCGYSLGGAVAVQLAAELAAGPKASGPKGLILESTFTSISELFRTFRWGWLPITALITERFDSIDAIAHVKAPLLVIHGSDDALVPARLGRALYEHAGALRKRFVLVDGGTHFSASRLGSEQYRQAVRELFGIGA